MVLNSLAKVNKNEVITFERLKISLNPSVGPVGLGYRPGKSLRLAHKTNPLGVLFLTLSPLGPRLWKAKRGPRKSSHLPKHLHHWMQAGVDAIRSWAPLNQRTVLVIETKEERGLVCLKGHPSHIKTTEFAPTAALRSQCCCQFNRVIPVIDAGR
jgi:hypothetical protein